MVDGVASDSDSELYHLCYSHCGVEVNLVLMVVLLEEQVVMGLVISRGLAVADVDSERRGVGTGKVSPQL